MQAFDIPRYLGPIPHPSVGVRMPDIFLEGILAAYMQSNTAGGLMLSYGRETAPEYVIDADSGTYDITLGHTGVSIKEYITKSVEAARKKNVLVEIEADHLIIGSSVQAVKRILGEKEKFEIDEEELSRSLAYNKSAIEEAVSTSHVNVFTIDATSLINADVEKYSEDQTYEEFQEKIKNGKEILKKYNNRDFIFSSANKKVYRTRFTENEIMRMTLMFKRNIEVTCKLYSFIREQMGDKVFSLEIALDEIPRYTGKELLFYLRECESTGMHIDFVAPYIGFKKRSDFDGDLKSLEEQLTFLAAIANDCGAILSIHSGSGLTPYGGKGKGVYETILRATDGKVKYKISGVYFELLMDLIASSKKEKHRKLFNEIFDNVAAYVEDQISRNTAFASEGLRQKYFEYKSKYGPAGKRDNRSEFFRHYSFIALNLRDPYGKRYLKERLIKLYYDDEAFKKIVDQEVKELTLRLIDGLKFSNNIPLS